MHEAASEDLHADADLIHESDALGGVSQHGAHAFVAFAVRRLDLGGLRRAADRQHDERVVARHREDLGHDHMGMDIDRAGMGSGLRGHGDLLTSCSGEAHASMGMRSRRAALRQQISSRSADSRGTPSMKCPASATDSNG